jgi:hypothetical protein
MKDFILNLMNDEAFIFCAMAVVVFILTNLFKIPIKAITNKITDERKRRMANAVILVIPFVLGVALEFVYSTFYLHIMFSIIRGIGYGSAGISLYGVVERFFKVKVRNEWEDTEEGREIKQKADELIAKDEKTESAVEKFKRTVNNN